MKILYLGTTREASGWGEAARSDLRAMQNYFNVVHRPVIYAGRYPSEFEALEIKPLKDITHVIQYCLPTEWRRIGDMKHIGYLEIESKDISRSAWADYFCLMDEIWVPNTDAIPVVSKVFNGPVKYMPHNIDTKIYENFTNKFEISEISGTYKFLTVSENVPRKNLKNLIVAYWKEFDPTEPVSLIIKSDESVESLINSTKKTVNLYGTDAYQRIVLLTERYNQQSMLGIYNGADCYVNPSMGESWCLPIVHAMGLNKPIISLMRGGPKDLLEDYNPLYTLSGDAEWCEGHNMIPGYQNAHDTWVKPTITSLAKSMRYMYENRKKYPFKSNNTIHKFNYLNFIQNLERNLS